MWILAWRSRGKIMELFSKIFVGTLMYAAPGGDELTLISYDNVLYC